MAYCYDKMELKELAAQTRAMYRNNYEGEWARSKGPAKKKWYKLWLASYGDIPHFLTDGDAPRGSDSGATLGRASA